MMSTFSLVWFFFSRLFTRHRRRHYLSVAVPVGLENPLEDLPGVLQLIFRIVRDQLRAG